MGFIKGLSGVQDVHVYAALMCLSDVHVGVLWINFILLVSLYTTSTFILVYTSLMFSGGIEIETSGILIFNFNVVKDGNKEY